jgi:hypothetical protein
MANATISYFGQLPTTIVMKTSDGFDGSAQTGVPVITPGLYTFPLQALGGLYNFHSVYDGSIEVKNISYKGTGTLTIKKSVASVDITIATIASGEGEFFENTTLSPGETLKFICAGGAATVAVTAVLTSGMWGT